MLQTLVQRDPADRQGDDITDSLLTTIDVQVSRGQSDINQNCSDRLLVDSNIVPSGFVLPTSIIQITDNEVGPIYGIVNSFSLSFSVSSDSLSINSSLTYEREEQS